MKKKQTAFWQNVLTELVKNTLTLTLGFIFSTALIGGASYLLFNTQADVDEINRLGVVAQKMTAEGKIYYDMIAIYSEGYISDTNLQKQIAQTITYLTLITTQDKLDSTYKTNAVNLLNSATLRLTDEKGKISGFSPTDKLIIERRETFLEFYDNQLSEVNEMYEMIKNWDNETPTDRDKRLSRITELDREAIELVNKMVIQSNQIVYDIEHVKYSEIDRLEAEVKGKQRLLQLKTTLSWVGVIIGFIIFSLLGFYTVKIHLVEKKTQRKKKTG